MDIKLIRAFIASPGGLEAERRAAFLAADEINKSVAVPMGGRLELYGWEETLSGSGRPQEIINAEMETCELFIGAMWTSWGSRPSIDGPYTSGFHEEFELSRARYARSGYPHMAMFFKSVDANQLRDPGQDLQKVLDFQARLRAEKSFLYDTFSEVEDFAAKVRKFLSTHVIRLLKRSDAPPEERPTDYVAVSSQTEPPEPAVIEPSSNDAPDAAFLSAAATNLLTNTGPGPIGIARIRLIAAAHGKPANDKYTLGVHDANLLYEARRTFEFSFRERRSLLEAGLIDIRDENVPVWTWLADLTREQPDLLIKISAIAEPAERIGAINAMRLMQAPIRPEALFGRDVVDTLWLGQGAPPAVKQAALRYLRDLGTSAAIAAVQRELDLANKETAQSALETLVAILMRTDEAAAVEFVLKTPFENLESPLLNRALRHIDKVSPQELSLGLDHRSAEVRAAALHEMSERNTVDLETLKRAQNDDAPIVRYVALRALDKLGQSPSLDEALNILSAPKLGYSLLFRLGNGEAGSALFERYARERMRTMSQATLVALLDVPTLGVSAYQTLAARRLGDYGARLRQDLRDGFQAYFDRNWPDGIKPTAIRNYLTLGDMDPGETKKRGLILKALDVVAAQRDAADLSLVRDVLDKGLFSPSTSVITFLKVLGDEEDIGRLGRTSRFGSNYPPYEPDHDFNEAARLIAKFHRGKLDDLLSLDLPSAIRSKLIDFSTAKDFSSLGDHAIVKLLLSSDDDIRRSSARKVAASLTRGRVAKILASYREDEAGRFYIVTHWLDLGLAFSHQIARRVVSADR